MIPAIQQILHEGGLTLYALLALAVAIYAILFGSWCNLISTAKAISSGKWSLQPSVGKSLPWKKTPPTTREIQRSFAAFELDQMAWVERRLPFLTILISTAPLLGLLGTVAGMLMTFSGMAAGGNEPLDTISTGISKALITTQAGLVIALPAAFLLALLKQKTESTNLALRKQLHTRLSTSEISPTV